MRLVLLQNGLEENPLTLFLACEYTSLQPGGQLSSEHDHAGTLILDFQPLGWKKKISVIYESPCL